MRLYLVQHVQAKTEAEDPLRALSEEGRATAAWMAKLLARSQPSLAGIWHSDKLRARQTAEVFATSLRASEKLVPVAGLAPLDDVTPLAARLQQQAGELMIVGHLPHLSQLASTLLVGNPEQKVIDFQMAGVVCLLREDADRWSLEWILTPQVASRLGLAREGEDSRA